MGLRPAWPYLAGYLAFLGLAYAGYFTGTTGQTWARSPWVSASSTPGQPPGYLRAFVRATLGSVGVLAAGAGLIRCCSIPRGAPFTTAWSRRAS
jgi:hypothetical protein